MLWPGRPSTQRRRGERRRRVRRGGRVHRVPRGGAVRGAAALPPPPSC
eukprot:gene19294-biopygen22027